MQEAEEGAAAEAARVRDELDELMASQQQRVIDWEAAALEQDERLAQRQRDLEVCGLCTSLVWSLHQAG